MFRNAQKKLENWLKKTPRKPLVIRGARQVGKSTLVRQFADAAGLALFEVNLERYPQLDADFASLDTKRIINALESLPKAGKLSENSLLFLDEIQATPHALAALRYFYEDLPRQPIICAGSLLEFILSEHEFSIPVGRIEYLHLGPMSFDEYLLALEEKKLLDECRHIEVQSKLPDLMHQRLVELLRQYFFIGGMPEAVLTFTRSQKLSDVRDIHESIIDTYRDDFAKYGVKKDLMRLHLVFDYAARSVGKKVKYVNISREEQSRTMKSIIDLLAYARVITKVYHSHSQGLPLSADIDDRVFKPLFLDVGIMNAGCKLDWQTLTKLNDLKLINAGAVAEQFVGQELIASEIFHGKPDLTYWLREGKEGNAEVDYVINLAKDIIPIEVKAGKSGMLKSLLEFAKTHSNDIAVRFDLNQPSLQRIVVPQSKKPSSKRHSIKLYSFPIYLVGQLRRLLTAKTSHVTS